MPLRVAVANVTSVQAHLDTVLAWGVDLLLVPKIRLTVTMQRVVAARLREVGWQAFLCAPLESRGRGRPLHTGPHFLPGGGLPFLKSWMPPSALVVPVVHW